MDIRNITDKVSTEALLARPLPEWRPILANECQVYVFDENYIAKRFDQINYRFCSQVEAKEVLIDNLYALLRFKYFPKSSEEVDSRIDKIVSSFSSNLKTTLIKVSFDKSSDCKLMEMLPNYCVAFRNGVYNFKDDCWMFKYDIIKIPKLANTIYSYDPKWAIMWYMNYDFESLGFKITETSLEDFIGIMKELVQNQHNYCFELAYNICHDELHNFSLERFNHLCEVLGYTVLQSFSQFFVMLIGSGQNGKNSLFDGCFSSKIVPRPAANDLDEIETDKFITGSLENKYQNIFLETSAKTYTESKMIKALTGSMYQTIQPKGINKYSGIINCKYLFAGNDQDKIKFSDTTTGFKRRINMFEIWYRWDSAKKFLKLGDYYDTTFSDTLSEIKDDILNTTVYIYLAMYGIMSGTKQFQTNFQFTANDWNDKYADVDYDMKEAVENVSLDTVVAYINGSEKHYEECKVLFFDINKKTRLYSSPSLSNWGYKDYDDMIELLQDPEASTAYFMENEVYISVRILQSLTRYVGRANEFSSSFKKLYNIPQYEALYNNRPYVKCTFNGGKLQIKN